MYEPKVTVTKVLGECTADPSMKLGDYLTVRDGGIRIPEEGFVCLLSSLTLGRTGAISPHDANRENCEQVLLAVEREWDAAKSRDGLPESSTAKCGSVDLQIDVFNTHTFSARLG